MTVKNSSKTSEFFNKTQLLYNTNVRGDVISSKPSEAPKSVAALVNEEFYNKYFTHLKAVDRLIYTISDYSLTCIMF